MASGLTGPAPPGNVTRRLGRPADRPEARRIRGTAREIAGNHAARDLTGNDWRQVV